MLLLLHHRPLKRTFLNGLCYWHHPRINAMWIALLIIVSVARSAVIVSAQQQSPPDTRFISTSSSPRLLLQTNNNTMTTNNTATTVYCVEPQLRKTGAFTLQYNYKVETLASIQKELTQTLQKLESVILQQLAVELLACSKYSFTNSASVSLRSRRRGRRRAASTSDLGIIGFDSSPIDSISSTSTFPFPPFYIPCVHRIHSSYLTHL
jgi:hypothetical protein